MMFFTCIVGPGIAAESPEYAGLGSCQARRLTKEDPASRQIPLTCIRGLAAKSPVPPDAVAVVFAKSCKTLTIQAAGPL
jgi:hypothetical protein